MSKPPSQNQDLDASLKKGATIWAVVIGVITAASVYWILEQQSGGFRILASIAGGVAVAIAMYRKSIKGSTK